MIEENRKGDNYGSNFIVIMIIVIELYIREMHYLICQYSKQNDSGQHSLMS